MSAFVSIFRSIFKRVFKGQKICPTYFEIGLTYFKIQGTYFFFAPMWGKRTENQFSLFRAPNGRFSAPVFALFLSAAATAARHKHVEYSTSGALQFLAIMVTLYRKPRNST